MKKTVSGNEAIAYGALRAGVKVVSGYPGTPSTEVISSLLKMDLQCHYSILDEFRKLGLRMISLTMTLWILSKKKILMKMRQDY